MRSRAVIAVLWAATIFGAARSTSEAQDLGLSRANLNRRAAPCRDTPASPGGPPARTTEARRFLLDAAAIIVD